jgi:hypothetical protein
LDLITSPLGKSHDRKYFDCGEQTLNQYLHPYASQDIKRGINKIFVASPPEAPQQVIGFYGLRAGSLDANDLPEGVRRRLPRYPLPVAQSHQGHGLDSIHLADALQRIAQTSQVMAVYAVVVSVVALLD